MSDTKDALRSSPVQPEVRIEPDKLYRRILHMERWSQDVLEHITALLRDDPHDFEEAIAIQRISSRLELIRDIKRAFKGDYSGLDTIYSQAEEEEEDSDLFVYKIAPIDIGWERLKSVQQTLIEMFEDETCEHEIGKFAKNWHKAKELARKEGWEGDFRGEPAVFWMPWHELEMVYGFAFKQDNNGTTYVISLFRLPWLDI